MEAYVDRSALLKDVPRKCWVALNENENTVIGHGDTIEAALAAAATAGCADPILTWVPERQGSRVTSVFTHVG